jgi:hypothetical protein
MFDTLIFVKLHKSWLRTLGNEFVAGQDPGRKFCLVESLSMLTRTQLDGRVRVGCAPLRSLPIRYWGGAGLKHWLPRVTPSHLVGQKAESQTSYVDIAMFGVQSRANSQFNIVQKQSELFLA